MPDHPYPEVAAELVAAVDWESLGIPKGHRAGVAFRGLAKRLCFDSSSDLSNIFSAFIHLNIYGFSDRAKRAALVLRGVPNGTRFVEYDYISSCVTTTCCFLERSGDMSGAAPLRELALNSPGEPYRPHPNTVNGSMLEHLFDSTDLDRDLNAGLAIADVARLSRMWVFGSPAPEWTKQRIGQTIDANVAGIKSLKRFQAW